MCPFTNAPSAPQFKVRSLSTQFNITSGDITVNEDAGEVEVCVTSDVSVTREITIAAETQSKEGAIAQATGECNDVCSRKLLPVNHYTNLTFVRL